MDKTKSETKNLNIHTFLNDVIDKLKENDESNKNIFDNINDLRIKKNILFMNLVNKQYIPFVNLDLNYLTQISLDIDNCSDSDEYSNNEEILMFWRSISKKVEKKEVLNFPMCVLVQYFCKKFLDKEIGSHKLSFLKHTDFKTNNYFLKEHVKEILFQKIIIFYILDTHYNLSSDLFEFEYISDFSNKAYTYKIKDLVFTIHSKYIILLSPKTKLIKQKLSINDFINTLHEEERNLLKNKLYENFYELLLENFIDFFEKKLYNTKNLKQIMELSNETNIVKSGNVYILSSNTLSYPVYVLILYSNDTHIKYLVLFDSTIQKTLSMSKKIVNKTSSNLKFFYPDLIFEKSYFQYCIGF